MTVSIEGPAAKVANSLETMLSHAKNENPFVIHDSFLHNELTFSILNITATCPAELRDDLDARLHVFMDEYFLEHGWKPQGMELPGGY